MKRLFSLLPVLTVCLALIVLAAFSANRAESADQSELARAKRALQNWEISGTKSSEEAGLIEEYYVPRSEGRENPTDSQGGPDLFGYRWVDNQGSDTATYAWVELRNDPGAVHLLASAFSSTDDGYTAAITIPGGFSFYGTVYPSVRIITNGNLQFTTISGAFSNFCLPVSTHGAALFAFWDDLILSRNSGNNLVHYKSEADRFIVEWDSVNYFSPNTTFVSLQVMLYTDGYIKIQYKDLVAINSATVGIQQSGTGTQLQYVCNVPGNLATSRAIWFYPTPPLALDFECTGIISPSGRQQPGAPITVAVNIYNRGANNSTGTASFIYNGGVPQIELLPLILTGQSVPYTFTATAGPSPQGSYPLSVSVNADGDQDESNGACATTVRVAPCVNALINAPGSYSASTCGAFDDCALRPGQDQIVQVNLPYTGDWTFQLCDPVVNWDSYLIITSQCCGGATIGADDDDCPEFAVGHSQIACTTLTAGTYFVDIEPYSMTVCSTFTLQVIACSPPPGCAGTVQLSSQAVSFPETYVGMTSAGSVLLANTGGQTLCVDSIPTNGSVFNVLPQSFSLAPGETQPLSITFSPTFSHNYEGFLTAYTSDAGNPMAKVSLLGTSCSPAVAPSAPRVFDAGSSTGIYYAMSWDANDLTTRYAIEISANGFATSHFADWPIGISDFPVYYGPEFWARHGTGYLGGLMPSTPYLVRLRAMDCVGAEVIGPAASISTRREVAPVIDADLTIKFVSPDSIDLRWYNAVSDTNGQALPNQGFAVYSGTSSSDVTEPVAVVQGGSVRLAVEDTIPRAFFLVRALADGVFGPPSPVITWPPESSVLAGLNSVVIQDFLHDQHWDSFRVTVDSAGIPVVIGSSWSSPWTESGEHVAVADFSRFGVGPHTITAHVVDHQNQTWSQSVAVTVVPLPHANFTASYSLTSGTFVLDTAGVTSSAPIADFLWMTSVYGEFYGPAINFQYQTNLDSVSGVEVQPQTTEAGGKALTEEANKPAAGDNGGVEPATEPAIPKEDLNWCCDNMVIHTAGNVEGDYGQKKGAALPRGAIVACNAATGEYIVAFAFEIELTLKATKEGDPLYFGQDCKRTSSDELGRCSAGPPPTFKSLRKRSIVTGHKKYKGTDYPRAGAARGNDDYRPDNHYNSTDTKQLGKGKVRWFDAPNVRGALPGWDLAVRQKREAEFIARADPQCAEFTAICCRQWEVVWDVTICPDCSIIQHTPPTFQNEVTPNDCPDLAGN